MFGSKIAGFSRARLSVGSDSANDCVMTGTSSSELLGDEHDDEPDPIFEPFTQPPSLPLSMPESVGLSSFLVTVCTTVVCPPCVIGRVTAVIVVPAGIFGCESCCCDVGDSVELRC